MNQVFQAIQSISGILVLREVRREFVRWAIAISGANRCVLLMPDGVGWQATTIANQFRPDAPLQWDSPNPNQTLADVVPLSVVHQVQTQARELTWSVGFADQTVTGDRYFECHHPQSIGCYPLRHRSQTRGLLYLEHHSCLNLFTSEICTQLEMLAAQGAIAIGNAQQYQQLEQTQQEAWQLFQNATDAMVIVNMERLLDCNAAAEKLFGLPRSTLMTLHPITLSPEFQPDGRHSLEQLATLSQQTFTHGSHRFEWVHLHAQAHPFWTEIVLTPISYHGEPCLHAVIRDISLSKQLETDYQDREAQFRTLTSNIEGVVYRCLDDENWTMIFMSEAIESVSGYPVSDFDNNQVRSYASVIYEEDSAYVDVAVASAIAAQQSFTLNYRIQHQDGSLRWVYEKGKGIFDQNGTLLHIDGVIFDVTTFKETEAKLHKSQTLLQLALDTLPQRVFWKDLESRYLGCNQKFADDVGLTSPSEIIGKNDFELPWRDTEAVGYRADDRRVIDNNITYINREQSQTRQDGRLIWLRTSKLPLKDEKGQTIGVFGSYEDITMLREATELVVQSEADLRRKSTELEHTLQELQQMQLQLVQSEKMSALGNLFAGVAHEINNPIGFLNGNIQHAQQYVIDLLDLVELLRKKCPPNDAEVVEAIAEMELEFMQEDLPKVISSMNLGVQRIGNISKSLRIFSRQDQEHKAAYNLHEGLDSTLLILKHRTKASPQRPEIQVQKSYGEIPAIDCFPGQLNQVFMNILANAVDALDEMHEGKGYVALGAKSSCLTVTTRQPDENCVEIQLQDNGPGMTPEIQAQIFSQGFTTKGVGKGTGLGLAIAHQIVTQKHEGTLTCTSSLGQGTTFTLTLPITK